MPIFIKILFPVVLSGLFFTGISGAAPLITCEASAPCKISVYRSDAPSQFESHTIAIAAPIQNGSTLPIPATNQVTFSYDGTDFTTRCDGTWRDFGSPASTETQNKISCTVERENTGGTGVAVSLRLYCQNVYAHPYADPPGQAVDPQLNDTSAGSQFCLNDDPAAPAAACKWQQQNLNYPVLNDHGVPLNSWVVYARTDVSDLALNYDIPEQDTPFNDGDLVCMQDINSDGMITSAEMSHCVDTGQSPLCPLAAQQCVNGVCPSDDGRPCIDVDGTMYCSPYDCQVFNSQTSITKDDTQEGATDKQDDGQVDANGNCLGTVYIFNGRDHRCRDAGIETAYHDCCEGSSNASVPDNPVIQYDLAAKIDAVMWTKVVNTLGKCKKSEDRLAVKKDKGLCHYVGSYCILKTAFGVCLQRKKTYCCFNSKLGRILQEQGRLLLKSFAQEGWGTPKAPYCRGFTADEFQMLDFSKMDLSGWYDDITTTSTGQISSQMKNTIQNAYGK